MKLIKLPCYEIEVTLEEKGSGGTISSNLHEPHDGSDNIDEYNAACDALESIILGHACAGVDIEDLAYIEGIETAEQAIGNNFS